MRLLLCLLLIISVDCNLLMAHIRKKKSICILTTQATITAMPSILKHT